MMNILVAGASGFIGTSLVKALQQAHQVTVLGRDKATLAKKFTAPIQAMIWSELDKHDPNQYDVIINLAGHNISEGRWNDEIKAKIIDSRVNTTETLIKWILKHEAKSRLFCANAIGIYGTGPDDDPKSYSESSPLIQPPHDFLSEVGIKWHDALHPAIEAGVPVTELRFGVVLQKGQGMLKKLYPSFIMGLGSVVGTGNQVISWVSIDDLIRAISFLIEHSNLTGPFNITSPHPVTQETFAKTYAKVLHRPLWLKTPAFVIKLLLGEMGELLILKGKRVIPKRLEESGFAFSYQDLEAALTHLYA